MLRHEWVWLLLLVVPYAASFVWLKGGVERIPPLVVFNAPLGLLSVFEAGVDLRHDYSTEILTIHAAFWPLYFAALIGARRWNLWLLRVVFIGLALVLVLTCYGCASNHEARGYLQIRL